MCRKGRGAKLLGLWWPGNKHKAEEGLGLVVLRGPSTWLRKQSTGTADTQAGVAGERALREEGGQFEVPRSPSLSKEADAPDG